MVKYYYVEVNNNYKTNINEISKIDNNDVTGIGWIKLKCVQQFINNEKIEFNYHAKKCLKHFFNIYKEFF